jgi:hypothetical protein
MATPAERESPPGTGALHCQFHRLKVWKKFNVLNGPIYPKEARCALGFSPALPKQKWRSGRPTQNLFSPCLRAEPHP